MPSSPRYHPCIAIECSRCHAQPQAYCRSLGTGEIKRWPHKERKRAFTAQVAARVAEVLEPE